MTGWNSLAVLTIAASTVMMAVAGAGGQAPSRSTAAPGPLQDVLSRFKGFYETRLREAGIVGSGIMVVRGGRVLFEDAYGMARLDPRQPADRDTIYHWASITKTFTAIGIMQLRDRGLLTLDDPIVKYIPELRQVHDPYGDVGDITLRHLLTHSAGFRDPTWPWGGDKPWHPFEPTRWEQLVAMFPYTEILFKPGSRHSYSNPGFIFLGRVIEQLTGDDYEVYIDKNILKPLEMYRSYFDATPYHLMKYRSGSFYLADGTLRAAPFDVNTGITVSNGGLNAPLTDMVKYLDFLSGNESRQDVYEGVLKRASIDEMWKPQLGLTTGDDPNAGDPRGQFGLSFFLETHAGRHLIGHSGSQNGFISHIYLDPASRAAWVVAFNTEARTGEKEVTRAVDAQLRDWLVKEVLPLLTPGHM